MSDNRTSETPAKDQWADCCGCVTATGYPIARKGCEIHRPPMMTVDDLRRALEPLPGYAWVCIEDGVVVAVTPDLGAGEPFVLLEVRR